MTPTLASSSAALPPEGAPVALGRPGVDGPPIVIIGAGLAGWTTVREFRKLDAATPVLLITADSGDFYAKPTLSNAFAQKRSPTQLVTTPAARMVETLNVTLMAHTRVTGIDALAKTVRTGQGDIGYRSLVLATGAMPIRVPVQGDAAGVYALGDGAQYANGRTLPYVMPIMNAARVLAARLAGQEASLVFPVMPVVIKTPALPLLVAPPVPGCEGGWEAGQAGEWRWHDRAGALRGFALAGAATAHRAKLVAALCAPA